jgi:uncharacterized peroxidase-related enzyme
MEFKVHDTESAPQASKSLLQQAEKAMGMIPNVLGVLAESPLALNAYLSLDGLRNKHAAFNAAEQQFILLSISASNKCNYCVAAHSALATQAGVASGAIDAVRAGETVPDRKLEALRRFVVSVKDKQGWVDRQDLADFEAAGYGSRHVLDVIALLAMKTISNYANHIAQTPVDSPFAEFRWDAHK